MILAPTVKLFEVEVGCCVTGRFSSTAPHIERLCRRTVRRAYGFSLLLLSLFS
jgi:hypothetical protein